MRSTLQQVPQISLRYTNVVTSLSLLKHLATKNALTGLSDNYGSMSFAMQPELSRDYPLNLSISLSGGKETNKDSLSNGE